MLNDLLTSLPDHLRERATELDPEEGSVQGEFVLYWMHHAVRAEENPALDTASHLAVVLDLPLLVYQGLAGKHPFNNDRHHTFILEGARDVRNRLDEKGIRHVFHLATDPAASSPLSGLMQRAAIVVTEDFPAPPFPGWTRSLQTKSGTPFLLVDAACIVPIRSIGKGYSRAYHFRNRIQADAIERAGQDWPESWATPAPWEGEIDGAVDWSTPIAELVASCRIDHSVAPVPHTRGGTGAGMARWEIFLENGLRSYGRRRNDPVADGGVSRMSAYLHHGHVSPFRIARDAVRQGSDGAEKFLDELLIWRELAFNLCLYNDDVESVSILPDWARETLSSHSDDERPALYDWETLARSKTGDPLWNAAQRSLLIHGELHNNVRMTWGKAVLSWTRSPQEALATLLDLNHRYALDGSDPNSYGGILWCLGMLDRPFYPEKPILGTVRPRSSKRHAERMDMPVYTRIVSRPARGESLRVAVIGAGPAGLMAARTLQDHAMDVTVFDKGRGPGGRTSTRHFDEGAVDHGAPFFRFTDERLKPLARAWARQGLIHRFRGIVHPDSDPDFFTDQWMAVPHMRALAMHLAEDLAIHQATRIKALRQSGTTWTLSSEDGDAYGPFDHVVIAIPARQAMALVSGLAPLMVRELSSVDMAPVWTTMVAFDESVNVPWDAAERLSGELDLVIRNRSKTGRDGADSWVLHGSGTWSVARLEHTAEEIGPSMIEAFQDVVGTPLPGVIWQRSHRWRYARTSRGVATECVHDAAMNLTACGDWATCGRDEESRVCGVETALLSGMAAAGRILGMPVGPGVAMAMSGRQPTLFNQEENA